MCIASLVTTFLIITVLGALISVFYVKALMLDAWSDTAILSYVANYVPALVTVLLIIIYG